MQRELKIEEVGDFYKKQTVPLIRLRGKWLEKAGFQPGTKVVIEVHDGHLVVKPAN